MSDSPHLSSAARQAIASPENEAYLSIATAWEIGIKRAIGKLRLPSHVRAAIEGDEFRLLPITLSHIEAIEDLPHHHRDPFDRMLVAQANVERMTLITSDSDIARYEVERLW